MNLPIGLFELTTIIITIFLAAITIFFSIKEEKAKKTLQKIEKTHKEEMRAKEDSFNMTVHDLKAPLTAIKDAASLLLNSPASMRGEQITNDEEKEKLLILIHEQAKRMFEQIAILLDAAKLSAGRLTMEKTSNDLKKIIQKQIDVFTPVAQTRGIELTTDVPDTLPRFSFDPLRISEVITNLLSNSFKFTQKEGKISVLAKEVAVNGKVYAQVSVQDTGSGIPEERQKELFSRFEKSENPLLFGKKTLEGSGLGLYIVKGIIEEHGGTISVQSEVGKGTTISFTLPLS